MKKILAIILSICFALYLTACNKDKTASDVTKDNSQTTSTENQTSNSTETSEPTETSKPVEEKISFSSNSLDMTVGSTALLKIETNIDVNKVVFSSSNENIAKYFGGEVLAKSKGKCKITATTPNGTKAECTVTVGAKIVNSGTVSTETEPSEHVIREIIVEKNIPDSNEYERFTVKLTNDNFSDYLCYAVYNYYNAFNEVKGCVPLFRSVPYDEEWILVDVKDFAIICSFDVYTSDNQLYRSFSNEELVANDLFAFPNFYFAGNCENYCIENFTIEKIKGELTYISKTIVDTYNIDNNERVVTALGETYNFSVRTKDCLF